jgi:hypothetical protein
VFSIGLLQLEDKEDLISMNPINKYSILPFQAFIDISSGALNSNHISLILQKTITVI